MRVEANLKALLQPEVNVYALIDLANVASEAPQLQRFFATKNALCLFGDPSPAAQTASPWLLSMCLLADTDMTCKRTVELAQRSSAVSWISSSLPAPELVRRLQARTEARLPDNYDVLLRHFDPRVLPVLHEVLRPPQRDVFFALGVAWLYLDRASLLTKIALTPAPEIDGLDRPFDLDDHQSAALLDAAEIDAVMPELVKEEPDRFLALGNGSERYRFTQHSLERARHWSLNQFPQQVVFCTLALRFGPDFDEAPAWQQALRRVSKSDMCLSDAIEHAFNATPNEQDNSYVV